MTLNGGCYLCRAPASLSVDNAIKCDPTAVGMWVCLHRASRKTQLSVLLPFIVPDRSAIKTNYLIPRRNVPFFRNVYLNWPCFVLRNIRCFKSCLVCFCIQIYSQFTQRQRGKWFKKTTSQVHVLYVLMFCVFRCPPPCLPSVKDNADYRSLIGSIPEATVTGHCVPPSRRWPFPACPAWLCRAPRWTCPCWVFWTCWRRWSGSPGCGLTSFPLAQSSLEPKHPPKKTQV